MPADIRHANGAACRRAGHRGGSWSGACGGSGGHYGRGGGTGGSFDQHDAIAFADFAADVDLDGGNHTRHGAGHVHGGFVGFEGDEGVF